MSHLEHLDQRNPLPTTGDLSEVSRSGLVLRLSLVGCTVLFGLAVIANRVVFSEEDSSWWVWVFAAVPMVFGVRAALTPQGHAPLGLLLSMLLVWWVTNGDPVSAWTLLAAAMVFMIHTVCAVIALVPEPAPVPSQLLGRYGIRAAVVMTVTALLWLVIRLSDGAGLPGGSVVLLVAAGVFLAAVGGYIWWALRSRA